MEHHRIQTILSLVIKLRLYTVVLSDYFPVKY